MVQHVIVTWTPTGIQCVPQSINLWTDDQEMSFILGPNTAWASGDPSQDVIFYNQQVEGLQIRPWAGSTPVLQSNNTIAAVGPGPATEVTTYACTVSVKSASAVSERVFKHDPEIYNQPQP